MTLLLFLAFALLAVAAIGTAMARQVWTACAYAGLALFVLVALGPHVGLR